MVVNKHGSFYLRSGWGTKIIQAVNADDMIFTPANEMQAVDNIGLGRVMIKALRYWADATGLTSEQKVQGGIREEKTDIYMLIDAKDRYFQKPGSLLLLHRNLARNDENATAWYWAFNEFEKQTFTKEEFVDGLHSYLAVNGMAIKKAAVDKEFNCFKNTYLGEKKFDIKTVADEDTYPMLAPLHMLRINDEKKYENFKAKFDKELNNLYNQAWDFKGFMLPPESEGENPFENGYPLHPITLFALPLSLDSPSSYAAWIAALIFSTVAVSDFGMMRETLYLGAPPLIDLGSHTLA